MINVTIAYAYRKLFLSAMIEKTAGAVLDHLGTSNDDLSVVIQSDEYVAGLNKQYRGMDEGTDVLSFSTDFIDPDTSGKYIGDVVISFPRVQLQAQERGVCVEDELKLMIVHGLLHLHGYEHEAEEDKAQMWQMQGQILQLLGVDASAFPDESIPA